MSESDSEEDISLGIAAFRFSDLYDPLRLRDLHAEFWRFAEAADPGLAARFAAYSADDLGGGLTRPEQSKLLIAVASQVGRFFVLLFDIDAAAGALREETRKLEAVFRLKQDFLRTRVFRRLGEPPASETEFLALDDAVQRLVAAMPPRADPEVRFAEMVLAFVDGEAAPLFSAANGKLLRLAHQLCARQTDLTEESFDDAAPGAVAGRALALIAEWCVQVLVDPARRAGVAGWVSFLRPGKLDYDHLVEIDRPRPELPEALQGPPGHRRLRDGFRLTDPRMNRKECLREIDYCILCHPREKDSCSHGLREKDGVYQLNPLGVPLTGCPLEERISEMHALQKQGETIAALAMIMLDNPMCPGTGHRICNDCMKGCIFQKQDPVNIPQAETGVVSDVLSLPWGFEIYSLLTRFNPLHHRRPYPLPYHGADVLVVGLGPAGYTLAHYLANDGFGVVGIDGLKLEPVRDEWTGRGRRFPRPIRDYASLRKELDERLLLGFGGVSEYGITVRWDKNFLAVMYLTLLRRRNVRFYGGVRFGGTLELEDAWELGFRHVALATGAGKPTIVPMKNRVLRGVRTASDFLMALQLSGAFQRSSPAALQVRLPAVVIGGGLTAIDTATELLAYYPVQVEKALAQFERLAGQFGEESVWRLCDDEESGILREFLEHGRAIRAERALAQAEGRPPDLVSLCRSWGGVAIAYRKRLGDSPAYRLNHEEVAKALEEGIEFVEGLSPAEAIPDRHGAVAAVRFRRADGSEVELPARAVCMAAGTTPNTVYEREHSGTFQLDADGRFFRKHRLVRQDSTWTLEPVADPSREAFFTSYESQGRFVSFYGDNHPDYAGNVVKAMASAKHGARQVARLFEEPIARAETQPSPQQRFDALTRALDEALVPRVVDVRRLTPTIVEVVVRGRYAARRFQPGQFYRLQNFESLAPVADGVRLTLEGIALTGAWVDVERDLLGLIVLEMGVSSRLCALLKPGEPVVVMGPTGAPSQIPKGRSVLLAGGGLGNAVLFSIGRALRARGSRVLYFAGYRRRADLFLQEAIEQATDQVVWAVDQGEPISPRRPQDITFVGNIVQAMLAYAQGQLGASRLFPLSEVDHLLAIGSDRMMAAVADARRTVLAPHLKPEHEAIASINSMMQCMLKEVCGQCLQQHVDPRTGEPTGVVFSCFNQDQPMDCVDFANLRSRLKTNSVAEKLGNRFLDAVLAEGRS